MTRLCLYVAHKLGAPDRAGLDANLASAMRWLSWLRRSFPETTFIAPWIANVASGDDDDSPARREAGLVDACEVVRRCDGLVLVGDRVSSGMSRECAVARKWWDLIGNKLEGPTPGRPGIPFLEWWAFAADGQRR